MTCSYCDGQPVRSAMVSVGTEPAKPALHGTKADHRKIVVIRVCWAHLHQLPTVR